MMQHLFVIDCSMLLKLDVSTCESTLLFVHNAQDAYFTVCCFGVLVGALHWYVTNFFYIFLASLNATVYNTAGVYHVAINVFDPDNGVATAIYNDNLETTGWAKLHISTNAKYADAQQAYAAGVIEGYLTEDRIYSHWNNLNTYTWQGKGMPEHVKDFLRKQAAWTSQQIKANPQDNYWQQVNTVFQQYAGLVYGYNNVASAKNQTITAIDMHTITSFGDLFEIAATKGEYRPDFNKMPTDELINYLEQNGHCSGLIKLADDLSDICMYTCKYVTNISQSLATLLGTPMYAKKYSTFNIIRLV